MKVEVVLDIDLENAGISQEEFWENNSLILSDLLNGNIEEIDTKVLRITEAEDRR